MGVKEERLKLMAWHLGLQGGRGYRKQPDQEMEHCKELLKVWGVREKSMKVLERAL